VGQGFTAPTGTVFGTNACIRLAPFTPRYEALTVSDMGRSRGPDAFQFCAKLTSRSGSIAKVFSVFAMPSARPTMK
jgi:hypothetical protein